MRTNAVIDTLVADLRPVRRHSLARDAALVAAVAGAELAWWLSAGFARDDFADAIKHSSLRLKLVGLFAVALLGTVTALTSLRPGAVPRRGLGRIVAASGVALAIGCALDTGISSMTELAVRLDWHHGLMCLREMAALSLPPAIALGLIACRGAPTDLGGTALACGMGASGWGAFVFAFACPSDDPLYIMVWYVLGCGLVTIAARTAVARLARW